MASTTDGSGYWLAGRDGAIYNFGTAPNRGSRIAGGPPVVAIAHN
jgi:hypothetical protein